MEFSLNSLLFGVALSFLCVAGLGLGVGVLFRLTEIQAKGETHLTKGQRVQRYLLGVGMMMGQLALIVGLIMKFSYLLNNLVSWAIGFVVGVFVFSILRLPLISRYSERNSTRKK